jgi:hypothetical protein
LRHTAQSSLWKVGEQTAKSCENCTQSGLRIAITSIADVPRIGGAARGMKKPGSLLHGGPVLMSLSPRDQAMTGRNQNATRKSTWAHNQRKCRMYKLTPEDAVDIWLRTWCGEYQYQIAASYVVNQGRINDVLKERLHLGSKQIAEAKKKRSA